MAQLIGVQEKCDAAELNLKRRQLPLYVDDNKIMIMQLDDTCDGCAQNTHGVRNKKKGKSYSEEVFVRQYNTLSREEALSALMVPSKNLFNRLAQVVDCVGCRRSVERLFNQLKDSHHPAMEPLAVDPKGILTVIMKYSFQPRILASLFTEHSAPLQEMLESIPKFKKSGRCVLHSMEGVRCRPGSQSWLDMWDSMAPACRETITLISSDQLLVTLDNYLRKHRFCHDCKNKVHRAYNILVGNINVDSSKEKGYVASLYAGIRKCSKKHIHVSSETDYIMHLITRAEPELQGRRERHAKTIEIAQEEVLTCLGLFLYERFQRIHAKLREEEQTWYILFHVGLDALWRNFELAVEEKQGFSKFEMLCEELQNQELREKAKKEKKKKKKNKNKKKNEETKENYISEDEEDCHDCEINIPSPIQINSTAISSTVRSLPKQQRNQKVSSPCNGSCPPTNPPNASNLNNNNATAGRKNTDDRRVRGCSEPKERGTSSPVSYHHRPSSQKHPEPPCNGHNRNRGPPHQQNLECSESIDSLVSRCSQCSKDGGYCSAQCSGGSSRESSDIACGEGFCSHSDDIEHTHLDPLDVKRETGSVGREYNNSTGTLTKAAPLFTLSLQNMLDDSSCDGDEIPEAEVKAWHARLGAVKQKRAELRQTLRQRFQQLCYNANGNEQV